MVLQIRDPIGVVWAVGTLEPDFCYHCQNLLPFLTFNFNVVVIVFGIEWAVSTLEPGLGVTGKKVILQVMAVPMGEVTSFTFPPFRLLLLPMVFGMDIQFAFGGGYKVAD